MDYTITMIRCTICQGTKQLLSLGNILKECDNCLGTGFIEQDKDDTLVQQIGDDTNIVKIKYKRGRPKKDQSIEANVNE